MTTSRCEFERYKRALKRILEYRTKGPTNEWSEAAAFHAVQEIAGDALEPSTREARIRAAGLLLKLERRRVGALVRGARYFYVDHHGTMDGSWVRFLKGDGERLGLVHVKALERVGRPSDCWQPGTLHVVHVSNLQASPGVSLVAP